MKNVKLTYRRKRDYLILKLMLTREEYNGYQIGKYGYLRLDYLKNYKKVNMN